MGKNKLAKFDDMAGYPHVFQYPFAVLQAQGFQLKGHWNERFFKNDHPIVLELGWAAEKGNTRLAWANCFRIRTSSVLTSKEPACGAGPKNPSKRA